jgi:hypothetical protein
MTESTADPADDKNRTIVLIYGILGDGQPFWLFAAVKPSQYKTFQETYREGKLDIHKFDGFGEIIVCGEGKNPPDSVVIKVAEMYQTDAATLMGSMVDEPPPAKK